MYSGGWFLGSFTWKCSAERSLYITLINSTCRSGVTGVYSGTTPAVNIHGRRLPRIHFHRHLHHPSIVIPSPSSVESSILTTHPPAHSSIPPPPNPPGGKPLHRPRAAPPRPRPWPSHPWTSELSLHGLAGAAVSNPRRPPTAQPRQVRNSLFPHSAGRPAKSNLWSAPAILKATTPQEIQPSNLRRPRLTDNSQPTFGPITGPSVFLFVHQSPAPRAHPPLFSFFVPTDFELLRSCFLASHWTRSVCIDLPHVACGPMHSIPPE